MKKNNVLWAITAVLVVAVVGTTVYFGKPDTQKGALQRFSPKQPKQQELLPSLDPSLIIKTLPLTISLDPNTPPAAQVIAGTTPPDGALKFKLTGTNKDQFVKSLKVSVDTVPNSEAVTSMNLAWSATSNGTYAIVGSQFTWFDGIHPGYAVWNLSGAGRITVAKNTSVYLKVTPTYSPYQASGKTPKFLLSYLQIDDAAGTVINTTGIVGNPQTVLSTKLILALKSDSPPSGHFDGGTQKYLFGLTASALNNAADPAPNFATITSIDITVNESGAAVTNLKVYPSEWDSDYRHAIFCTVLSSTTDSTIWRCTLGEKSPYTDRIDENTSRSYVFRGNISANGRADDNNYSGTRSVDVSVTNNGVVWWADGALQSWVDQPEKVIQGGHLEL